jgi:hypothetical protein
MPKKTAASAHGSFCLHCHRKTPDVNPKVTETKNGRRIKKSMCAVCRGKKAQFVKS